MSIDRPSHPDRGSRPPEARETPTLLQVQFRRGKQGDVVGHLVTNSPRPSGVDRGDEKLCFVAREYRGLQPSVDETWIVRFVKDTQQGQRKGVWIVSPMEMATERFELVESRFPDMVSGVKPKDPQRLVGLLPAGGGTIPEDIRRQMEVANREFHAKKEILRQAAIEQLPTASQIDLLNGSYDLTFEGVRLKATPRHRTTPKGVVLAEWKINGEGTMTSVKPEEGQDLISSAIVGGERQSEARIVDWTEAQRMFGQPHRVETDPYLTVSSWRIIWQSADMRDFRQISARLNKDVLESYGIRPTFTPDDLTWKMDQGALITHAVYPNLPPLSLEVGKQETSSVTGSDVEVLPAKVAEGCPDELIDSVRAKLAESVSADKREQAMKKAAGELWAQRLQDLVDWQAFAVQFYTFQPQATHLVCAHWMESIPRREREEGEERWSYAAATILSSYEAPASAKKNQNGIPIVEFESRPNSRDLPRSLDVKAIAELDGEALHRELSSQVEKLASLDRLKGQIVVRASWKEPPDPSIYSEETAQILESKAFPFEEIVVKGVNHWGKNVLESVREWDVARRKALGERTVRAQEEARKIAAAEAILRQKLEMDARLRQEAEEQFAFLGIGTPGASAPRRRELEAVPERQLKMEQREREPVSHEEALRLQREVGRAGLFVDVARVLWESKKDKGTQRRLSNWGHRADGFAQALTRLDEADVASLCERAEKLALDARQIAVDAARETRKAFREDWTTAISEGRGRVAAVTTELELSLTPHQANQMEDRVVRFVLEHGVTPDNETVFDWIAEATA